MVRKNKNKQKPTQSDLSDKNYCRFTKFDEKRMMLDTQPVRISFKKQSSLQMFFLCFVKTSNVQLKVLYDI